MDESLELPRSEAPASFQLDRNDAGVPFWLLDGWPASESTLHVQGSWPPPRRAIAIIGSTTPSPTARSWAFSLARVAASRGWAIVSGLARGTDAAAHEGALAANGLTIAVTGNGIPDVSPPEHEDLASRILAGGGTRITLASPNEPVSRERLLQRNALTSAASVAVVAVQSRGRDGTLSTMRHAFQQRRLLASFEPPSEDNRDAWEGNRLLLSERPPWRTRLAWSPAFRLLPGNVEGYVALLAAADEHISALDSAHVSRKTASSPETINQIGLFVD